MQAREAALIQANLTLALERLNALDDKINSKLDSLTALLQTQSQTSQSLQEQFMCLQSQQNRIAELLAPLHPILQSVPLHIDVARNAIIEKIPEGCQCIKPCSGPALFAGTTPPPKRTAELSLVTRKRRRTSLDFLYPDPHMSAARGYLDLDQRVETARHQTPHGPVERTVETQNLVHGRRTTMTALSSVQTLSGSNISAASGGYHPESVRPESGNAALATRLSAIVKKPPPNKTVGGKGIAPPITVFRHSKRVMDNPISYISSRPPAVPGKRFILFDEDDDDDDDGDDNDI